ncbi:uncharacterized protein LOC103038664 isoform X1 [Astyanax mexicanus]|uniref:Uncharacterized LOC103038664 n=1 Tax=Astyanax mexicanus TaxID=7994 RepID=A0A3B1KB29_ASTMX|nr:uncharacterized protein LOC103038664 isoform X1 [Astyanax mexicanus]
MEKGHFAFVYKISSEISLKGNNTVSAFNHTMLLSLYLFTAVFLPFTALEAVEMLEVELGQAVTLKCNISLHHEIFWLKVSMEDKPRLLMVAGLKSDGIVSDVWNYDTSRYRGSLGLDERFFGLKILHVLKSDLASYYCGTLDGKRMEFEEGVHIYAKPAQPKTSTNTEKITSYEQGMPAQPETKLNTTNITSNRNDPVPSVAENGFNPYTIFAAVLGVGQLGMLLAVVVVHLIAGRPIRKPS